MAELTWTAEAERWLRDIHDFIAQDNPAAATRTIETLYQKTEILREFPESGYRYWQREGGSLVNLLCSRNARPEKALVGRAQ
jgi:toxin ParE1/3/4